MRNCGREERKAEVERRKVEVEVIRLRGGRVRVSRKNQLNNSTTQQINSSTTQHFNTSTNHYSLQKSQDDKGWKQQWNF
jgi:hypothetical protein